MQKWSGAAHTRIAQANGISSAQQIREPLSVRLCDEGKFAKSYMGVV
jgi:hypothetical protein